MNREPFVTGEYYHCYNRGTDKRVVFEDAQDFDYFLKAMELFNREDSLGGMMEYQYPKNVSVAKSKDLKKLVNIYAFCLNPNHYHLILQPNLDDGVQKFMQKVSTGYTMYFNKKYERTGSLFQGRYKSIHIMNDQYLRHLLTYVSFNNEVHKGITAGNFRSNVTAGGKYKNVYDESLITELYNSVTEFKVQSKKILPEIRRNKELSKNLKENPFLE